MIRVFILNDKKTCVNVDNDTDAQRLIDNGAFEIQDLSVFNGHENLVSAENTVVNPKDMSVTFTYPEDELTLFQLQQEQTTLETQIAELKDQLSTAILANNEKEIESIKSQYQTLVGGE